MTQQAGSQSTSRPEDLQRRIADALNDYARAVQWSPVPDDQRKRLAEARRSYVAALKETIANIDPSTVDANTLAAISQSVAWAAWLAASVGEW